MAVMTKTEPSNRIRTLFAQSAKGEWRVAEITIEISDHEDPAAETSDLFDMVWKEAQAKVNERNNPATITHPSISRP